MSKQKQPSATEVTASELLVSEPLEVDGTVEFGAITDDKHSGTLDGGVSVYSEPMVHISESMVHIKEGTGSYFRRIKDAQSRGYYRTVLIPAAELTPQNTPQNTVSQTFLEERVFSSVKLPFDSKLDLSYDLAHEIIEKQRKLNQTQGELIELLKKTNSSEVNALTDIFGTLQTVNEDQTVLAFRAGKRKAQILAEEPFADLKDILVLMPAKLRGGNISRTLTRWQKKNKILGLYFDGGMKYPICQINPKTSDVYSELADILPAAANAGYEHWEILDWYLTPVDTVKNTIVGKPVEGLTSEISVDELFDKIDNIDEEESVEYLSPRDMLVAGMKGDFLLAAKGWLGDAL